MSEEKKMMRYVEKITNPSASTRLNIELGDYLLLEIPGTESTVKTALIGIEPQQYLIVRIPIGSEVQDKFSKAETLDVTYISLGTTYGFTAKLLGITEIPVKLLFLSYPSVVVEKDQRESPRVNCHIPATAIINDTPLNGIITDMSHNGCRFVVRIPIKITPYQVRILTDVHLSFALHGIDGSEELLGVVRNTSIDRFRIALGIEFENLTNDISDKIKDYLEKLIDY